MSKTTLGSGPPTTPDPESMSTIAVLHKHSLGPSRREKVIIPIVLLALGALLVWGGIIVWDHVHRDYSKIASIADLEAAASRPLQEPGGLAALLNPGDARYLAFDVRSWQFWAGKGAITDEHLVILPGLKGESIESLVKGERGASVVTFRLDLARSDPPRYHVDDLYRGGVASGEADLEADIYPLNVTTKPAISTAGADGTYRQGDGITYDRTNSFRVGPFTAEGRLQQGPEGFWIQNSRYSVPVTGKLSPGMQALLGILANTTLSERLTYFMTLEQIYPWTEGKQPGRRQATHQLGPASLDGVALGKIYVGN